jgi:cytochrome c553
MKRLTSFFALIGLLNISVCAYAQPTGAPELLKRGEKIVGSSCFLCHGLTGESSSEIYPRLAGQHAEYIAKQLDNFKTGARKSTAMSEMVKPLSSEDMKAVGVFFENQKLSKEPAEHPDLAGVGKYIFFKGNKHSGVPACASCHGQDAKGTAQLPRLAGQHAGYIEYQLTQFNTRERNNDNAVMHSVANKMTALEIEAVAQYLSGQ